MTYNNELYALLEGGTIELKEKQNGNKKANNR